MRPTVVTKSGTGTSAWIPLDYRQAPFNVSIGCVINGTITYSIEYTYDDIYTVVSPVPFVHSTLTAQTANKDGFINFPVRAVRINNTLGTGDTTATILQGVR